MPSQQIEDDGTYLIHLILPAMMWVVVMVLVVMQMNCGGLVASAVLHKSSEQVFQVPCSPHDSLRATLPRWRDDPHSYL